MSWFEAKWAKKAPHLSLGEQFKAIFAKHYRKAVLIGVVFAFVQPLTGVNPILFYAPMVFEQTGIGTSASFASTLIIGVVSFLFTALAIVLVDRIGRRPLVNAGLVASGACLLLCFFAFKQATYSFSDEAMNNLQTAMPTLSLESLRGGSFDDDISFKDAVSEVIGTEAFKTNESIIIQSTVSMKGTLVLIGIVGFIAAFHVSIGPLMWVVFSEIVPIQNSWRGYSGVCNGMQYYQLLDAVLFPMAAQSFWCCGYLPCLMR